MYKLIFKEYPFSLNNSFTPAFSGLKTQGIALTCLSGSRRT
ncbi:MAG: hypothetical protein ABIJ12_11040 [bacterium]